MQGQTEGEGKENKIYLYCHQATKNHQILEKACNKTVKDQNKQADSLILLQKKPAHSECRRELQNCLLKDLTNTQKFEKNCVLKTRRCQEKTEEHFKNLNRKKLVKELTKSIGKQVQEIVDKSYDIQRIGSLSLMSDY